MSDSENPDLGEIEDLPTLPGKRPGDKVFGRFILKKIIGRGGMGIVWHAFDDNLKRDVALKFVPEIIRFDPSALDDLKHETRQGQSLAHPNIVKIHDLIIDDEEGSAIFMELIDGASLAELRIRQPAKVFQPETLATWTGQLLNALTYAHQTQEIVHRDLKPANLLVDPSQNLKVLDFGISRCISDSVLRSTMVGNSTGTLAYMSPQQASGSEPSIADDLYSVGSTLYELLTGKPPFYSGNIGAQLREGTAPPIDQRRREFGLKLSPIPVEWENAIQACLAKNPELRPASAGALADMLGLAGNASDSTTALQNPAVSELSGTDSSATSEATESLDGMLTERATAVAHTHGTLRPVDTATWYPDGRRSAAPASKSKRTRLALATVALAALAAFAAFHFLGSDPKPQEVDRENLKAEINLLLEDRRNANRVEQELQQYRAGFGEDEFFVRVRNTVDEWNKASGQIPAGSMPVVPDNYETIAAAIKAAKEGATIKVRGGTYNETLLITKSIRLQAEGDVTLLSDDPESSVLYIADTGNVTVVGFNIEYKGGDLERRGLAVVQIEKANAKLENCNIRGGLSDGVQVSGSSSSADLSKCTIEGNAEQGVMVDRGAKATMVECHLVNNGHSGLYIIHLGSKAAVSDSQLNSNGHSGLFVEDSGAVEAASSEFSGNLEAGIALIGPVSTGHFQKNRIFGNRKSGLTAHSNGHCNIVENTISSNEKHGIEIVQPGEATKIDGNQVQDHPMRGIFVFGDAEPAILIENNQVSESGLSGILIAGRQGNTRVLSNQCRFNGTGIELQNGAVSEVAENVCEDNAGPGIHEPSGASAAIGENTLERNGTEIARMVAPPASPASESQGAFGNGATSGNQREPVLPAKNASDVPVVAVPANRPETSRTQSGKDDPDRESTSSEPEETEDSPRIKPALPATNAGRVPLVKLPPIAPKDPEANSGEKKTP